MSIPLEKRHSYTSKSILSILQTTNVRPQSNSPSIHYYIPSSIFIIFSVLSIWAIFFYLVLGICYYFNPGILLEDLNMLRLRQHNDQQSFDQEIHKQFSQLSSHCFFSLGIYSICLSLCLFFLRYREQKTISYLDR